MVDESNIACELMWWSVDETEQFSSIDFEVNLIRSDWECLISSAFLLVLIVVEMIFVSSLLQMIRNYKSMEIQMIVKFFSSSQTGWLCIFSKLLHVCCFVHFVKLSLHPHWDCFAILWFISSSISWSLLLELHSELHSFWWPLSLHSSSFLDELSQRVAVSSKLAITDVVILEPIEINDVDTFSTAYCLRRMGWRIRKQSTEGLKLFVICSHFATLRTGS